MDSEKIILRPIEDTDIDHLHKLLNDSNNQQLVGGSVIPMSRNEVLQWLQAKRSVADACQFAIETGGVFCGYVQLVYINRMDGHATLGININQQFQGRGLGRLALQQMHDFARNKLLLRKIVLYVRSDNQPAVKLYLDLGYHKAGTLTQHVKTESGYVGLEVMEFML